MKIDGFGVGKFYEQYSGKTAKDANPAAQEVVKAAKTDRVEISSKAADMNKAALVQKSMSSESIDERQSRIDNIKSLVDAGQYNIPTKTVAQSILRGSFLDKKA